MKRKLEKPILAEGEVTGHMHTLEADVDVFELDTGVREFNLKSTVPLTHQEHKVIELPPDVYFSDRVVEFDPFEQAARKVMD